MVRASSSAMLVLLACGITALGAPRLQVHQGATVAPGSNGLSASGATVDFGAVEVGTATTRTFTVTNTGTEAVRVIEPIQVPRGFTTMRNLGTQLLAPGRSTTFAVALNSAAAGRLGGQVAFEYTGATGSGRVNFAVSGTAFGPPALRIVRNGDPGFRTVGRWAPLVRQGVAGQVSYVPMGTGASAATWTVTGLKPGTYQVAVTYTAAGNQASNARFTVHNGSVPFTPVTVNQRLAPADFQDAGAAWRVLGSRYFVTNSSLTVRLTDQADGNVVADAIRVQRVGFPGAIVNPGDPNFRTTAALTRAPAATSNASRSVATYANDGQVVWTFPGLVPGQYRVSVGYTEQPNAATNATFSILDGAKPLASVEVNERQAPHDLYDAGRWWKDLGALGALYAIRGKTLVVTLNTQGADGPVGVGPIRVERIYNPAGPQGGPETTTQADAARLLDQMSWGANDNDIFNAAYFGPAAYLDYVNSQGVTGYGGYAPVPDSIDNPNSPCFGLTGQDRSNCSRDYYSLYAPQASFFYNGLYGGDQLRQRLAWALHKIWVISGVDGNLNRSDRMSTYLTDLDYLAQDNFFNVMFYITLNPAMGEYLNMVNSSRGSPNENYAREIMQLFCLGLNRMNPDGSLQLDGMGNPIPTYDQSVVVGFAQAFTGWTFAPPPGSGITNYRDYMVVRTPETTYHYQQDKQLLMGYVLPGGGSTADDLYYALYNIFNDPNVPPFIAKSLIQELVTSNPSSAYINRVAQVFIDNGAGVRGDLNAVSRAILLDTEARGDAHTEMNYGKLREPAQYLLNVLRAFPATSADGTTVSDGYLNPQITPISQDVLRPPTVFSYFLPGWGLPGVPNVVGPEFQILDNVTTYRRANLMNTMLMGNGVGVSTNAPYGTRPSLSVLTDQLGSDPAEMADYLNYLLLHGTMSAQMRNDLITAVSAVAATNPTKRAKTAAYLVTTSPQYQVQR